MGDKELGTTKLDHVLSYICIGFEKTLLWSMIVGATYMGIYWANEYLSNWLYVTFFK